jgi:hypothetical protein
VRPIPLRDFSGITVTVVLPKRLLWRMRIGMWLIRFGCRIATITCVVREA